MTLSNGQTWQKRSDGKVKIIILGTTHFTVKYTLKHGGNGTVATTTKGKFYATFERDIHEAMKITLDV